jgi:predicted membrane protein
MNGRTGLALLMIAFGALILFDKIGFGLGHLMGYLIPIAMIALGYIGVRNGNPFLGWLILIIGAIILIGKMSGLISLAIAIGLIVYGISLFKKERKVF